MAPVGTVDEVVASLERLESTLPVSDGVHWFNRMYLEVTLAVRDYLAHHTQEAPRFLERLVVFFGNAYFSAVDGAAANPPKVALAWSPLFDARHDRRIAPLQFAAAGMNAHVGHDLAVGVVQICTELGMEPGDPQHHDYNGVSAILQTTEERVKRWLLTGAVNERTTELAGRAILLPLP